MDPTRAVLSVLSVISLIAIGIIILSHYYGRVAGVRSRFSRMLIRDEGPHRMLFFLQKNGDRSLESAMDRANPDRLVLSYSRMMMASHLFSPQIQQCLILGLGGGSMVKFLNRYFPGMKVDAVEIDPEVERVARHYFSMRPNRNTRIILEDAREFLERAENLYGVIHVDAFLKIGDDTDTMGIPLRLKDESFYTLLRKHLTPDGLAVFNINYSPHVEEDVKIISSSFPAAYRFSVPARKNIILIASMNPERITSARLIQNARIMDEMEIPEMGFQGMVKRLLT